MQAWLIAWQRAEGGEATNNPFNTTQPAPGATCYNRVCVRNYPDAATGIAATVATLQDADYADLAAGIATNDPERAQRGLERSPWGTHAALVRTIWAELRPAPAGVSASSAPLALGGDCDMNIRLALDASGGALRDVTIAPGATWSFNATIGDPTGLPIRPCAGVPGGGWCNLAARYAQVGRALGLTPSFLHHGVDLGAGPENDVLIWSTDGQPGSSGGRQDLELTNPTPRPVRLWVRETDGGWVVEGGQP